MWRLIWEWSSTFSRCGRSCENVAAFVEDVEALLEIWLHFQQRWRLIWTCGCTFSWRVVSYGKVYVDAPSADMAAHIGVATPMQIQRPIRNVAALFAEVEAHMGLGLHFLQKWRLIWDWGCTFCRCGGIYGNMSALSADVEALMVTWPWLPI